MNWHNNVGKYLIIGADDINVPIHQEIMRLYNVIILANEKIPGERQGVKIADSNGNIIAIRYIDGIDELPNELPEGSLQFVVGNPKKCFVWCKNKKR